MRVSAEMYGILARKYAGREFAVYDLKEKTTLGPWSAAIAAVYSARDAAATIAKDSGRFVVKHRVANTACPA